MPTYTCKRCNKTFSHYGNYNSHMLRLYPCDGKRQVQDLPNIEGFLKKNPIKPMAVKKEKEVVREKEDVKELIVENITEKQANECLCKYCGKVFSRKDVCRRHEKNNCKEKLKMDIQQQTIINNYQTINNIQNVQNNLQQNFGGFDGNIPINPFGKEDVSFLTNELMKSVVSNPDYGIPRLIRLIHFNPQVPQNQNVRLKNKKEPYLNVFNGQSWELRDRDDTIQDLITSKKEIADDYFENLLTNQDMEITKKQDKIIDALQQKKYETYTEAIDEYLDSILDDQDSSKNAIMRKYKRMYDKLYKQINFILMNNSQLANHIDNQSKLMIEDME